MPEPVPAILKTSDRETESQVRAQFVTGTAQSLKTDSLRLKRPRVKGESQYIGFPVHRFQRDGIHDV
jgi:hypothetical protein